MEELAKKYHATQFRNKKKTPYFEHLIGVKSILTSVFEITKECEDEATMISMQDAAIGHDLVEDTTVSLNEIIAISGQRVLHLIEELTNPVDDAHTEEYMQQLGGASEEARIIKYCDLLENTTSVCYAIQDLGVEWFHDFYEPILNNTTGILNDTKFIKYSKTASLLRSMLEVSTKLVYDKLSFFEKEENNGKTKE